MEAVAKKKANASKQAPSLRFPGFDDNWKNVTLENLTGKTISYGIVQAGNHVEDGMPYIKSIDLNTALEVDQLQRTSFEIAHKYRRSEVVPGDIVFSLRGNIGVSQIVPESIEVANLTQGTARISVSKDYSNMFIQKALQTQKIIKHVFAVMKGSTFQEISLGDLRQVKVTLPTLPEQEKIAGFLSAVDARIQQLTRKQALLEQYKKGVMQGLFPEALEGNKPKLRFTRADGAAYPDWEEKRMGEVVSFHRGSPLAKADLQLDGQTKCIHYGELFTKYTEVIEQVLSRTALTAGFKSQEGDILMPSSDVTPEGLATASALMEGGIVLGGDINILRSKGKTVPTFLSYLLNFERKKLLVRVSGTTVKHMYNKDLVDMVIHLPAETEEQQQIAGFLGALDARIQAVQAQVAGMQRWKQGLLQQLFV